MVAGAVVTGALGACSGEDADGAALRQRERQAQEAAADAGLPPDVQAFFGRAARAPQATFSATFVSGTDRVVVHQLPPRRRVDVLVDGAARESYVTDGTTTRRCERREERWRCTESDDGDGTAPAVLGAFSPELVARTVEALEDGAADYELDVHDLRVAGTTTTCLRAAPRTPTPTAPEGRLCITRDGVPLLVDRGDGSPAVRAVAYRPSAVADDVAPPDGR